MLLALSNFLKLCRLSPTSRTSFQYADQDSEHKQLCPRVMEDMEDTMEDRAVDIRETTFIHMDFTLVDRATRMMLLVIPKQANVLFTNIPSRRTTWEERTGIIRTFTITPLIKFPVEHSVLL